MQKQYDNGNDNDNGNGNDYLGQIDSGHDDDCISE
jgi:hypothetical protein